MDDILTTAVTVDAIVAPRALDDAEAAPFIAAVELANAAARAETGHDGLREEPLERLGFWHDQHDWAEFGYLARSAGEPVGAVRIQIAREPGTTVLEFDLAVEGSRRGAGVEAALLAEVEREARERGLRIVQTWTLHRSGAGGPRIPSPTGWGSVPADDPQSAFLLDRGFHLGQVERTSAFDLAADLEPVAQMFTAAMAVAGPDYRLVTWTAPTPERMRDGFAHVLARMSTDAPQGDTVVEEQHWDADRVVRRDARQAAQGQTASIAAIEHVPTGTLAAYNELVIAEPGAVTQQYGTLVLREHRGHRLGMIVKCANILRWPEIAPDSPRIVTFNAEENRPMLDINEAIGFVPISYAGAWKKTLVG